MITITFSWWMLPTAITLISIIAAFLYDDGGGYLSGITNIMLMVPALFISLISWIIFGVLK